MSQSIYPAIRHICFLAVWTVWWRLGGGAQMLAFFLFPIDRTILDRQREGRAGGTVLVTLWSESSE